MAFRELRVFEVKEILRLWARGRGYRTIARMSSVDRKTVRRYVDSAQALGLVAGDEELALDDAFVARVVDAVRPGGTSAAGATRQLCRTHKTLIEGWLSEGASSPKMVKLLRRHTGVGIPLRTLQRFLVEEVRADRRGDTVRVVDGPPGEILEVDFLLLGRFLDRETGKKRKLYALLCLAAYSRHQFVWPCLSQQRPDVIDGLEGAWRFFGGVFSVLLPDNMSTVVTQADPISPTLNGPFLEYAQSRGFEIDPARSRHPQDKGRVERQVRYVRDNYFAGERFGSLREARDEAARWCREDAATRTHGTTKQQPGLVFEREELPLLKPAPTTPYDCPEWTTATLGRDHVVVVRGALYSVPYQIEPTEMRVRIDRAVVKLFRNEKLVKTHPRKPPGGVSIDPVDLPPGKAELATRDGDTLARYADENGLHVGTYTRRLLDSPLPWTRMRAVHRLLGLCKRYGGELVDEACARSLELDVVDVNRIAKMLEKGLIHRGLVKAPAAPQQQRNNIIHVPRFSRDSSEWRVKTRGKEGPPDAAI